MREIFNQHEAADYLGVCPDMVTKLCQRGDLRHAKIGRALRIRRIWCDEYLERIAAGGCVTPAADAIFPQVI